MIDELVMEYLSLSDMIRDGYIESLGKESQTWREAFAEITDVIPETFRAIYSRISGTYRTIQNQEYMDFIPGYRLIHIEELNDEYNDLLQMLEPDDVYKAQIEDIIPILADYASDYICYVKTRGNEECVFHCSPDEGLQKMHNSIELFFKTIIAFYNNGVYFLDEDGFLDYDIEGEEIIGTQYNPGIAYWEE